MSEMTVEMVAGLAKRAHAGQFDKQGRDYFEAHLVPIAKALENYGEHAVMAGYLHDIIEDHGDRFGLLQLHDLGVPDPVVTAVGYLTRRADETYDEMIARVCTNYLAVIVKLADNEHNIMSNPVLAHRDPFEAVSLLRRYISARDQLVTARTAWRLQGIVS